MTGDFEAGQVAELTLTFDSGDTVTMDVPIVFACDAYEGLDRPAQPRSRSPTTEPSPVTCPPTRTESPTRAPSAAASGAAAEPYDCIAVGEG